MLGTCDLLRGTKHAKDTRLNVYLVVYILSLSILRPFEVKDSLQGRGWNKLYEQDLCLGKSNNRDNKSHFRVNSTSLEWGEEKARICAIQILSNGSI